MNTKRITGILPVLSLFFLMGLATDAQATTYSFKSVDVPGARNTFTISINASGQVTGGYWDYPVFSRFTRGFVYSGGQVTFFYVLNARETYAASINDRGQVAGSYTDVSFFNHGFVYSGGQVTSFDVPGALDTEATSINNRGQVAGSYYSYWDASGDHGFVYSEGKYTPLDVPGATSTEATSINDRGQVAGSYWDASSVRHGFVYSEGRYTSFEVPGATSTEATSINDRGQVAGSYNDASGRHGFVYSEGKFTSLNPPGATSTYATSINDHGQVAGYYEDASSVSHGFIATPTTPFSTFKVARLIIDQNRGALFLWSNFTLGGDNNGIDPVKEEVTLKIANATLTIPAGSFHQNSHPLFFAFAGQVDNVWIEAFIRPSGSNHFRFQALAYGAPLGDTKNPIPMELMIGDDKGTTMANASLH